MVHFVDARQGRQTRGITGDAGGDFFIWDIGNGQVNNKWKGAAGDVTHGGPISSTLTSGWMYVLHPTYLYVLCGALRTTENTQNHLAQAKNGCAEVMQTFSVYTWRPNLGEIAGFERFHRHTSAGSANKVSERKASSGQRAPR